MPEAARLDRRNLLTMAATLTGGVLVGTAADLPLAHPASAAPQVYTRTEWKARPPVTAATVLDRRPDQIVVHHTATANSTDYSLGHGFALSRSIQSYHMDHNGWNDTGQQLTISRGGHLMEGRNRSLAAVRAGDHVVGAHTANHNSHTIGIENEGTYMSVSPTSALWNALVSTCAWLCEVYRLDPYTAIVGHRDHNATSCPGDRLYAMLPRLRDEVAGSLGLSRSLRTPSADHGAGLPGPRHRFDHGPEVGPKDRTR